MKTIERWWEPRRDGEATAEFLGRVLDELGAGDMAVNARAFHYDDFLCPDHIDGSMNIHRLIEDLNTWALAHNQPRRARVLAFGAAHGEFDATKAEARAWAESPDGRAAFDELVGGGRGPES